MHRLFYVIAFLVMLLWTPWARGQNPGESGQPPDPAPAGQVKQKADSTCVEKDLRSLFRKKGKPQKQKDRKSMFLVLPNVSSNPVNGFLIGVAGTSGFYLGPKENTRVSSAGFNAAFTTKRQFLSFIKSNIYTPGDKFFLQRDWRFFVYRAPTWGLGTNAPDTLEAENDFIWQGAGLDDIDDGFQMTYNFLKFHEIASYQVGKHKYIGLGYHLDYFYNIVDDALRLDTIPLQLTPHFRYSEFYGFNPERYVLSGLSLNFVFDSRDHLINPYKGYYFNINYRYNPKFLGSSQNSSSLWMEFRTYLSLSRKTARHLIGFWFFGNFRVSGRQPYLTLMALGEDQRARSGRGYIAGRYRGDHMVYAETEYRFPISKCSRILGGVLFLNATTTSNQASDVALFEHIRIGVGVGLRVMLNKDFRTNINLDFGLGQNSQGFYFSGQETF